MSSKNYEENVFSCSLDLDLATHLVQIACFIFYEKWAIKKKSTFKDPSILELVN